MAMLKAFPAHVELFFFDFEESAVLRIKRTPDEEDLPGGDSFFNLALLHSGDADLMDKLECTNRVWYGGNGGYDPFIPQADLRIWRPIVDGNFLTPDEAKELLAYLNGETILPPAFLLPPSHDPLVDKKIALLKQLLMPSKPVLLSLSLADHPQFAEQLKTFRQEALTLLERQPDLTPFHPEWERLWQALRNQILPE